MKLELPTGLQRATWTGTTHQPTANCRAKLPPRASSGSLDTNRYKGDQDPSDDAEGLEYAKAYTQLQLKTRQPDGDPAESATAKASLLPLALRPISGQTSS